MTPAKAGPARKPKAKPADVPPKTKWGDREGRRRDILAAARAQMAAGGYLALNMRDIASRAGVSPGTLYSYFATKEEIFATLYAEAIEAHNDRIAPICAGADDLEAFLVDIATAYLDLYAAYGRYFTMWSALLAEGHRDRPDDETALPPALGESLRAATFDQGALVLSTIRRLAATEGPPRVRLVDDPVVMTFLWSVLNGLGDHVTSGRRHLTPFSADDLVRFAARTLAAGLLTEAR
jgi:AcrR family transcriptional regulator